MYVDESGDPGKVNSPCKYFVLTGIIFHESKWANILKELVIFRRNLKTMYGLNIREEIHSTKFINSPGNLKGIKKHNRVHILKLCLKWLNSQKDIRTFSIVINKTNCRQDVFIRAWDALINRFENTLKNKNLPGANENDNRGIIIPDNTDKKKLTQLIRRMRHYNQVPGMTVFGGGSMTIPVSYIIKDPIMRDSKESLLHQMVDVVAYFVKQKYEPSAYMKKHSNSNYYKNLTDIILTKATNYNKLGLVEL